MIVRRSSKIVMTIEETGERERERERGDLERVDRADDESFKRGSKRYLCDMVLKGYLIMQRMCDILKARLHKGIVKAQALKRSRSLFFVFYLGFLHLRLLF